MKVLFKGENTNCESKIRYRALEGGPDAYDILLRGAFVNSSRHRSGLWSCNHE